MPVNIDLGAVVGFVVVGLIGSLMWFIKQDRRSVDVKLGEIQDTLSTLVEKVTIQNSRVTHVEAWKEYHEKAHNWNGEERRA